MSFFISDAIAQTTPASAGSSDNLFSLLMIAVIFVMFYFMLIRPQNKRAKEHKDLISQLKKGDEVVTNGGLLAKVVSLDEQFAKVSLSEGVDVIVQRNAISALLPKGTMKAL
jgi:preprotein translocase subunit YajC